MGDRARQIIAIIAFTLAISIAHGMSESSKVVPASAVQAKMEMGKPVELDGSTIIGNLNLHSRVIYGGVHFNNSSFQGAVYFNSTNFKSPAYFRGSNFRHNANFSEANFDKLTDFHGSKFGATANFSSSNFNRGADFEDSNFNGSMIFTDATFNDSADFMGSHFNSSADFSGDNFNSYAAFQHIIFNDYANFMGINFSKRAYFGRDIFYGSADFTLSYFSDSADFSGTNFNSYAKFDMSQYEGEANFLNSKFNKKASFYNTEFNGSTSFEQTEFNDEGFFDGAKFRELLSLTKSKYNKIYIKMNDIAKLKYDESAYQLLIENFKILGYYDDADNGYYRFRVDRFLHRKPENDPMMYVLDLGAWIFYGFGKKPLFTLCWSLGIVLLFGVFWNAALTRKEESYPIKGYEPTMGNSTDEEGINHSKRLNIWNKIHRLLDPFLFSATIFLSSTKLFIDPPEIPKTLNWSPSLAKDIFTLERILGAFFSILLFIAIGGTVVR